MPENAKRHREWARAEGAHRAAEKRLWGAKSALETKSRVALKRIDKAISLDDRAARVIEHANIVKMYSERLDKAEIDLLRAAEALALAKAACRYGSQND